jgi:FkbM family methyltransferase
MNIDFYNLIRPDELTQIVDIGANPIDDDPPYKKMLKAGLCYVTGFEPQKDALLNLNKFKSNFETYYPYVIGSLGRKTLNICNYSGWTSLLVPDLNKLEIFPAFTANAKVIDKIEVVPRPLDTITEIKNIDFLKLDIQGSELDCLKSGMNKLKFCSFIQIEVSFIPLYINQPIFGDLDIFLRQIGFIPHCFTSIKKWPISPLILNNNPTQPLNQLLEADIVYVRNFISPTELSVSQLKQIALIAHYCYYSYDLAARCIMLLVANGSLPKDSFDNYISILNDQNKK